ncbi:uncharacterized protein LOC116292080 [Actinia tenebrosa]|uniref:Uncharacterized protein LOC116292080 n=1 Tax=Actinia tenebrosa TaxID=6105 RepID=A0A6P8HRB6_ACTTE|nr:uncharacterized protein LOC116292080 [Actinia tenebrosa]
MGEDLKKLPDSEFCNAAAFAWACQLTGPKPYINPKHDPPCYEDVEDDTKNSALEGSSTEELKKLPPSKFCNAAAFAWANQLEGPNSFQNSSRDPPCSEDVEDLLQ